MAEPELFRWQALFRRATEPVFLLDRQRRIRFVNEAWEKLTGLSADAARLLRCRRHRHPEPGSREMIATMLAPPPVVLEGRPGRARRLLPGPGAPGRWWDVEFFPLRGEGEVLAILGKVTAAGDPRPAAAPLPEKLIGLRESLAQRYRPDSLTSALPAMHRIVEQVLLAAQTRAAVLLVGETGTGKQWTARVIHHHGTQRQQPFAALDCARLPTEALVEAMFGAGNLTRNASTLYLQEPSALPRDLQARLCECLIDPSPERPRLIAGCSVEPAEDVRAGRLLADFHSLLGTLRLDLPPLRERREDLPLLVASVLERINTDTDPAEASRVTGLTPEAWELVRGYSWQGNLRELDAVLAAARLRAKGDLIDAADMPAYLRQAAALEQVAGRTPERPLPLKQLLEQVERRLLLLALRMARGNKSKAAELLAISRGNLLHRMKALKIEESWQ